MAEKAEKKGDAAEKEPKKGGKLKLIVLALVVLAILGGGGFAAWKFFLQPPEKPVEGEGNTTADPSEPQIIPAQMVTLEPFVVNLSDPMGRRYLKITMDVEMADVASVAELNAVMPRVKDTLLLLLSSKSFADISTLDQKLELKNDIVDRLNQIVGKAKVRNVYFTEFVIQ